MAIDKPKAKPICGIYMIKCIANDKTYIGSSSNVMRRIKTHKRELENGSHNNLLLQHEYTKYGADKFVFKVLDKDLEEEIEKLYNELVQTSSENINSDVGFCFSSQNITLIFCLVSSLSKAVVMDEAVFSIINTEISLICTRIDFSLSRTTI